MVDDGDPFTSSTKPENLDNPLKTVDPWGWLGQSIEGKNVLCLAAGGGKQGPLYLAAGANVTVVDLSDRMLAKDQAVQKTLPRKMRILQASMDNMPMLGDQEFDIVIHPVSTCYVPNILDVFNEVSRVLKLNGIYISQHKTPTSLQAPVRSRVNGVSIDRPYYEKGPLPAAKEPSSLREPGTTEFLHRWEEIIGGICRAGLAIHDFVEPNHSDQKAAIGSFGHRACFIAPYVRVKAVKLVSQRQTIVF